MTRGKFEKCVGNIIRLFMSIPNESLDTRGVKVLLGPLGSRGSIGSVTEREFPTVLFHAQIPWSELDGKLQGTCEDLRPKARRGERRISS